MSQSNEGEDDRRRMLLGMAATETSFARGVRIFDDGDYFAAHEAWEERWRVSIDHEERSMLQGLIQLAAAFHKLFDRADPESAVRLFERAMTKLEKAPAAHEGIPVATFVDAVRTRIDSSSLPSLTRSKVPRLRSD